MMVSMDEEPCDPVIKIEGEGNYASAMFMQTRDPETDQGLTLPPKITSSDQWQFDAACTLSDEEFEALLGPVQHELLQDDYVPREDDSWIHTMVDHDDHLSWDPSTESLTLDTGGCRTGETGMTEGEGESRPVSSYEQTFQPQSSPDAVPHQSPVDSGYGTSTADSDHAEVATEQFPLNTFGNSAFESIQNGGVIDQSQLEACCPQLATATHSQSATSADHLPSHDPEWAAHQDSFFYNSGDNEDLYENPIKGYAVKAPPPGIFTAEQQLHNFAPVTPQFNLSGPDTLIPSIEKAPPVGRSPAAKKLPYWMVGLERGDVKAGKKPSRQEVLDFAVKFGLVDDNSKRSETEVNKTLDGRTRTSAFSHCSPQQNRTLDSTRNRNQSSSQNPIAAAMFVPDTAIQLILAVAKPMERKLAAKLGRPQPMPSIVLNAWNILYYRLTHDPAFRLSALAWAIGEMEKSLKRGDYQEKHDAASIKHGLQSVTDIKIARGMIVEERLIVESLLQKIVQHEKEKHFASKVILRKDNEILELKAKLDAVTTERDGLRGAFQNQSQAYRQVATSDGFSASPSSKPLPPQNPQVYHQVSPSAPQPVEGQWRCKMLRPNGYGGPNKECCKLMGLNASLNASAKSLNIQPTIPITTQPAPKVSKPRRNAKTPYVSPFSNPRQADAPMAINATTPGIMAQDQLQAQVPSIIGASSLVHQQMPAPKQYHQIKTRTAAMGSLTFPTISETNNTAVVVPSPSLPILTNANNKRQSPHDDADDIVCAGSVSKKNKSPARTEPHAPVANTLQYILKTHRTWMDPKQAGTGVMEELFGPGEGED